MTSALVVSSPFLVGAIAGTILANIMLDSGRSHRAVAAVGLVVAMIAICGVVYTMTLDG